MDKANKFKGCYNCKHSDLLEKKEPCNSCSLFLEQWKAKLLDLKEPPSYAKTYQLTGTVNSKVWSYDRKLVFKLRKEVADLKRQLEMSDLYHAKQKAELKGAYAINVGTPPYWATSWQNVSSRTD